MFEEEWKQVGVVGVDAGLVQIGDPCYHNNYTHSDTPSFPKDWSDYCDALYGKLPRG